MAVLVERAFLRVSTAIRLSPLTCLVRYGKIGLSSKGANEMLKMGNESTADYMADDLLDSMDTGNIAAAYPSYDRLNN